ncbi:AraC family transcriptional regulator [Arachidicoccus ginsenosidivorans]|uniref:Helix-turn-helix domain-containing protein n=1 Tax=Arachidicoccus ginsenosidivorans TaxID=496057 RepID=A0A5B8VQP6_9BACT|nr:AraC family transcriptional regulator [Arachidicoccus ginsenosidivorans]QEC73800.1 helix-turn-helix domain-containing protein [Arachidicoccus ginsenosidivorans]
MKPKIQKLPIKASNSFVAEVFRTPLFEVGWHQHIEFELILFLEGSGLSFIGNHVGEFESGDIYFLGTNLPHTFQKHSSELITSAIVVQFREDFWGEGFLQMPECDTLRQLFTISGQGLKITNEIKVELNSLIETLEKASGFSRVLLLGQCLELIAGSKAFHIVSKGEIKPTSGKLNSQIDKVFKYTIENFKESITLADVADIACMSIPAFCNFFKRSTQKTYITYLSEIRVGYACRLLIETENSVLEICYESGYNTLANFHKQFLKIKKMTPLHYRKSFDPARISRGTNIGIALE